MLVFTVQLSWKFKTTAERLGREEYDKLRHSVGGEMGVLPAWEDIEAAPKRYDESIVTAPVLKTLIDADMVDTVKKVGGLAYGGNFDNEVESMRSGEVSHGGGPTTRITNVSVSNTGLHSVQEVHLLEDACTDMLQSYLSAGWRIVAVCPPNDARRPDYILGHKAIGAPHP